MGEPVGNSTHNPILKILSDDVDPNPIHNFPGYVASITNLIRNSDPPHKFSIGIFGEWGTGKTTLMRMIEKELDKDNSTILTVWFDAWRYERDEQFALVPLMKTIAYKMEGQPQYRNIREILLMSIATLVKGFVSKYIPEVRTDDLFKNINPMKALAEEDKNTIYFHGFKQIDDAMKNLGPSSKNKIVVFIDDLDRCSSKKALEVFESTKVFLDIERFIFVVGLSHDTLSKLISEEYKQIGLKGEEYMRKIIQVNINIPKWEKHDIEELMEGFAKCLPEPGTRILNNKSDRELITRSFVTFNPRELKRFINRFMISSFIKSYTSPGSDTRTILVSHVLESRWSEVYGKLDSDEQFLKAVNRYAVEGAKERERYLNFRKIKRWLRIGKLGRSWEVDDNLLKISPEMWKFLEDYKDSIKKLLPSWREYKKISVMSEQWNAEQAKIFKKKLKEESMD